MDYVFYAVGIIFILYQLFGKKYFAQKRLDAIVEHIAEPSTKYVSDDAGETSLAMYFYYACLILTCQKRDLSKMTRTVVDMAFRKTLRKVLIYKTITEEIYLNQLKHVFNIVDSLEKSERPAPEVLMNLIIDRKEQLDKNPWLNTMDNESKFGWLDSTDNALDTFAVASEFYVKRVGPTVDFLLEISKKYPN